VRREAARAHGSIAGVEEGAEDAAGSADGPEELDARGGAILDGDSMGATWCEQPGRERNAARRRRRERMLVFEPLVGRFAPRAATWPFSVFMLRSFIPRFLGSSIVAVCNVLEHLQQLMLRRR
jgi:hypothetical protein